MSAIAVVGAGLHAALLLARGRQEGLRLIDADRTGAARSFWAIAVGVPAVIGLRFMSWAGAALPADAPLVICRDLLVFVAGWLAYAVITWHLAPLLNRESRWPQFIATWNWCNVVENLLLLLGSVPGLLGAPHLVDQVSQLVATGWALWLEWYAARLALGVGSGAALWLVLLDQTIGLVFIGLAAALSGGT